MRKFKLIKEYPGSPKLETIVEVKHDGYIYWNVNSNENNPTNYIHNSSMEQYLEFWEEVIEKDYEILSYKTTSRAIWRKNNENYWINNIDSQKKSINAFLHDCIYVIHSVKRLSDNEIFTIGDKTSLGVITQIQFNKSFSKLWLDFNTTGGYSMNNFLTLEKAKQPLFTTEDGIDIFKGDKHWFLCDGLDEIFEGDWKSEFHKEYVEKCKCFSTKEKAEEYILLNKLCLSLNDVNEVFNNRTPKNKILYELKELVNTKING